MIEMPPPPVSRLIGFALKSIEPGRAVFEMEADERHHNPMGTLHGGIYCDLADAAMRFAYAATLREGETFTIIVEDQFSQEGDLDRRGQGGEGGKHPGLR